MRFGVAQRAELLNQVERTMSSGNVSINDDLVHVWSSWYLVAQPFNCRLISFSATRRSARIIFGTSRKASCSESDCLC